ncbi:MAG: hypothetical protein Q9213_008140, partial [Squamulea squamosa]
MAPHIMVLEPIEPHPHRNLYHDMVVNEREVLESRRRRCCRFTRMFAKRAAHGLQARLTRQHDAEHKEALKLFQRAKSHKLAENYRANSSTTNLLEKRMKAGSDTSTWVEDDEPESCEIISIRASVSNYTPRKTSYDADNKNGITVTTTALPSPTASTPSSPSFLSPSPTFLTPSYTPSVASTNPAMVSTTSVTTITTTTTTTTTQATTKQYRKLSWNSGLEEYEQIFR